MTEERKSGVRALVREEMPVMPLRGLIVFPNMTIPLDVGRERSIAALEDALANDRRIILAAQKVAKINEPSSDEIYKFGCLAEVKQLVRLPDGTIRVVVEGIARARIDEFVSEDPFYKAKVTVVDEVEEKDLEIEALMRTTFLQFEEYVKQSKRIPAEILMSVASIEDAGRLADDIAAHLPLKVEDKQSVLEALDPRERLEKLIAILSREMEILELERKIHLRVRKQLEKTQKEYYLREQMKAIQKELGDSDDRTAEVEEYRAKIAKMKLPKDVRERAEREVDRLEKMPPMAAEAVVVRSYLDWILSLPWSKTTRDRHDIKAAQAILDADHYGLEKVKERILEFLAVKQLTKKLKGPILCLVGPPGVGKTSLARSVAAALGRKFVRFSLGGVRDEAEIRGHRRTYVGAMPGRIIQALRQAGSKNPVILLDEIDKMASDFRGDPAAALLEALDPEQNSAFQDHYIEATFDLSDVMFITTANVLYDIPRPLLDRMEVINIPGYTEEEKVEIAKRHLIKKQIEANGLTPADIEIREDAVREIIRSYTRESGVRNLERQIGSIARKVARAIVGGDEQRPIIVSAKDVSKYLGIPRFRHEVASSEDRVGVATGLAWTEVGGDILEIEVAVMKGNGKLVLTGKLGEVMRESAQAGYTYIRTRAQHLGIDEAFHEKMDVHIHIPEGAIPKDGPSAGITMATALASALSGRPVRARVAMTGEITLRGRVLPIGGLKEKILAAHRAGIHTVIIPSENAKDLEEIPANIREALNIVKVDHMDEVLAVALGPKVADEAMREAAASRDGENLATPVPCNDEGDRTYSNGLPI